MATTETGRAGMARRQILSEGAAARLDRVSWGAIFAGAVVALALQLVFSLMSAGLGLSMVQEDGGGTGAGIMFAITAVLSLIVGGAVAGRMAGTNHWPAATLHGIVVWALVMLGVTWMGVSATGALLRGATTAASATGGVVADVAGGAAGAVGNLAGSAGMALEDLEAGDVQALLPASIEDDLQAITANQNLTPEQLAQETSEIAGAIISEEELTEARDLVVGAGRQMLREPSEADAIFQNVVAEMTAEGGVLGEQQFDELQGELQTRYGISQAESAQIADRWRAEFVEARGELIATYEETYAAAVQALNEAEEAAAQAASTASTIAWWTAIGSLLGLIAAAAGAAVARPEEDIEVTAARPARG